MKLLPGFLVLAFGIHGAGRLADAAMPGTIDDGGPEPGHVQRDPGPAGTSEPKPKVNPTFGDAEPAPLVPPSSAPSGITGEHDLGPRHRISLVPRLAFRLGDAGRAVSPARGFGLAGTYEFLYGRIGPVVEAALGLDFAFDRFATGERAPCSDQFLALQECFGNLIRTGMPGTFASTRVISETSFVLVHTIAARVGRLRPYLTLGAGVGIGFFDSVEPNLQPGSAKDVHVLGRATVGLDVPIWRAWSATVRADYTTVRAVSPFTTNAGETLPLFGDLFDVGIGAAYGF
jgi:hypothetical protein